MVREGPWEEGVVVPQDLWYEVEAEALEVPDLD